MEISRRDFLGGAAAAVLPLGWRRSLSLGVLRRDGCAILDLGEGCALPECVAGYESVLGAALRPVRSSALLVVPGAAKLSAAAAREIRTALRDGATVIVESGIGFLGDEGDELRAQARELLDIRVGSPLRVWPARSVPYVEYSWPIAATVRDFSVVCCVASEEGQVIARVNDRAVGVMRRVGSGRLIFLGSPLGPALWAGDAEARAWLLSLLGTTSVAHVALGLPFTERGIGWLVARRPLMMLTGR